MYLKIERRGVRREYLKWTQTFSCKKKFNDLSFSKEINKDAGDLPICPQCAGALIEMNFEFSSKINYL